MNLYHDIETIPGQSEAVKDAIRAAIDEAKENVTAPGNYKKPESIAAYIEQERAALDASFDERWSKTALNGTQGEICSIAFAIEDGEVLTKVRTSAESEAQLLEWFFAGIMVKSQGHAGVNTWIGHNCRAFDLRFIYQRAVILGVKPPFEIPHEGAPSDPRVFDTMTAWAGWGNRISLNNLCLALGFDGKGDMDGSKVFDAWQAGEYDRIAAYNAEDVEKVRKVHRRMMFA